MKKSKSVLQRLIVILTSLAGIAVGVVSIFWRLDNFISIRSFIVVGAYYCLVFFYGIYGYRIPHGNLIRYLMLILAAYNVFNVTVSIYRWYKLPWIVLVTGNLAAVLIAYMAGRLNKFKKNILVAALVTALLLVNSFWPDKIPGVEASVLYYLDRTLPVFMWFTIMSIYFFRYQAHTEAGLAEKA
ncbi:MAG: hypothetical protein IJT27_00055 [Clostridia bacterium]|nr:hypothetical protein [Clostridia bacterium]